MSPVLTAKAQAVPLARFLHGEVDYDVRAAYPADPDIRRGDAAFFACLRRENVGAFFDNATPDINEVEAWIARGYANDQSQINFIVARADGVRMGFFGLSDIDGITAEFGRVMRIREAPAGLMLAAISTMLAWAAPFVGIGSFRLSVFADNARAVALYRKLGFMTVETCDYTPRSVAGRTVWTRGKGAGARPVLAMVRGAEPQT